MMPSERASFAFCMAFEISLSATPPVLMFFLFFFPWCNMLESLICRGRRVWISSRFRLKKTLLSCVFLLYNNSIYKCCGRMRACYFSSGSELQKQEWLLLFISPWLFFQPFVPVADILESASGSTDFSCPLCQSDRVTLPSICCLFNDFQDLFSLLWSF